MQFKIDDEGYVIFGENLYTIHHTDLQDKDWFFSQLLDKTWMNQRTLVDVFLAVLPLCQNPPILTDNFIKAFTKTDY